MRTYHEISIAPGAAGLLGAGAALPAGAADQKVIVKAPVAAAPVVVCSHLN